MGRRNMTSSLVCLGMGPRFRGRFFHERSIINGQTDRLFPRSLPRFLRFVRVSLGRGHTVAFPCCFGGVSEFCSVMLGNTRRRGIVSVFYMSDARLRHTRRGLGTAGRGLSVTLRITSVVP